MSCTRNATVGGVVLWRCLRARTFSAIVLRTPKKNVQNIEAEIGSLKPCLPRIEIDQCQSLPSRIEI